MLDELKEYREIMRTVMNGYSVHVYEWDSPASLEEPKYAVSVKLQEEHNFNVAIKTITEDLKTSLGMMEDRILTDDDDFDNRILIYGQGDKALIPVFTTEIREIMLADDHLRMDINPEVIVVRRFGEAKSSKKYDSDLKLALTVAKQVDSLSSIDK